MGSGQRSPGTCRLRRSAACNGRHREDKSRRQCRCWRGLECRTLQLLASHQMLVERTRSLAARGINSIHLYGARLTCCLRTERRVPTRSAAVQHPHRVEGAASSSEQEDEKRGGLTNGRPQSELHSAVFVSKQREISFLERGEMLANGTPRAKPNLWSSLALHPSLHQSSPGYSRHPVHCKTQARPKLDNEGRRCPTRAAGGLNRRSTRSMSTSSDTVVAAYS